MGWKRPLAAVWAVVRWLFKALVVVTVLIVLLAVILYFDDRRYLENLSTRGANAWVIAIALVALAVLATLVFGGLARIVFSTASWDLFGNNATARLLGLGVSTYVFPRGIPSLIYAPVTVAFDLVRNLSQVASRLSEHRMPDTVFLDQTLARIAWVAEIFGAELSRALARLFEMVSIYEVILAVALWAIVGQMLSGPGDAASGKSTSIRLAAFMRSMTEPQRRIASLALVFLAGIYMSTAAIVAIPWLQDDKGHSSFSRDGLEKALAPLQEKGVEGEATLTPVSAGIEEQFKSVEASFDEARRRIESDAGAKTAANPVPLILLADVGRTVGDAKRNWEGAIGLRNQLHADLVQKRSQIVAEALNVFDSETVVSINSQERAQLYNDIKRAAQEQVREIERAYRECSRRLIDADRQLKAVSSRLTSSFKTAGPAPTDYYQAQSLLRDLDRVAEDATVACRPVNVGSLYVAIREPGQEWGPFAVVARWLLRTRSQELALITGMFGFGLLGSAVVTFVRPRRADATAREMLGSVAGEIASIVARGLSAAIVVFLTVKGGLAIFTTGEAQPNAYVLFFTCLVGAVFSEDVWSWARKKLAELFRKREQELSTAKASTK